MDYNILLEVATELAYRQAMAGAETYRVEECVSHIMASYGVSSEVFAIPNCLIVSIETPEGESLTSMKRIGYHGNDMAAVERYNSLSRRICTETPAVHEAQQWLKEANTARAQYRFPIYLLGHGIGALGFALFFGGTLAECLCATLCGLIIGLVNRLMENWKVNTFFTTIAAAFLMSLTAYIISAFWPGLHADTAIIGALMILVPGLLFTNAMRDIIFGDTNSGVNRTVQVLLIAAAIALGTASALSLSQSLLGITAFPSQLSHSPVIQCIASFIGCTGFLFIFNVHGYGSVLCALGGMLSWAVYCICYHYSSNSILSSFLAAIAAASYSEIMARLRKCPALPYLVVSLFPMLPGAGIYYTANCIVQNDMGRFGALGRETITVAGVLAVGILMVSTLVRLYTIWRKRKSSGVN